jgi:hypothetical protein
MRPALCSGGSAAAASPVRHPVCIRGSHAAAEIPGVGRQADRPGTLLVSSGESGPNGLPAERASRHAPCRRVPDRDGDVIVDGIGISGAAPNQDVQRGEAVLAALETWARPFSPGRSAEEGARSGIDNMTRKVYVHSYTRRGRRQLRTRGAANADGGSAQAPTLSAFGFVGGMPRSSNRSPLGGGAWFSRACRHLSQARAQMRWTPARTFLAVFS